MLSVVAMLDFGLAKVGGLFGAGDLSLRTVLGYAFAPLALVMGIETADVVNFGYLLGMKISLNEFPKHIDEVSIIKTSLVYWQ